MRSVKHSGLNFQKVALALAGADVKMVFRSFDLESQGVKGEIKSLIYQVCGFRETLRHLSSLLLSRVLRSIIYQMVTEERARAGTAGRAGA